MTHTFEYLTTATTVAQLREAIRHLPGDTLVNPVEVVLIDGVLALPQTDYTPAELNCPGCMGPCGACKNDPEPEPEHTKAIIL